MKVGLLSMEEDAARVKAVRQVIGDKVKLMLDANCSYKHLRAIDFTIIVEEYNQYCLKNQ